MGMISFKRARERAAAKAAEDAQADQSPSDGQDQADAEAASPPEEPAAKKRRKAD